MYAMRISVRIDDDLENKINKLLKDPDMKFISKSLLVRIALDHYVDFRINQIKDYYNEE